MAVRPARRAAAPAASTRRLYVAEPPAAYRLLPPLVVDCNILGALLFQEVQRADAERRIFERELNAPTVLDYEIASVALKKLRQGGDAIASDALARYASLPITLHGVEITPVLALAERYKLSAYDASYLWLAAVLKAPLATFDRKLGEAAQKHLSALE